MSPHCNLGVRLCLAFALLPAPRGLEAAENPAGLVSRDGASFVRDGRPFPAVGFNTYYLMVYAAEPSLRPKVDEVLAQAVALGATVLRTWAFNDGVTMWNALQTAPGVHSEKVFKGLDYVLFRARQMGLTVLLPLVNNWDDYGGMSQYVRWSPTAASHDDFYTDPHCRASYRAHLEAVLTRINSFSGAPYRDDPAIFGWELANEPRATAAGPAVLDAWIAEMAAFAKSVDPRHLLSTGSEGFYGRSREARNTRAWMAGEGVDFIANHSHAEIDFASFHAYPDLWPMSRGETARWVRVHLDDARAVLRKPALLGEFGKWDPIADRDAFFGTIYDEAQAAAKPGEAPAGLLAWALYHGDYPDYDGYGIYAADPARKSTNDLLLEGNRALRALAEAARPFRRGDAVADGSLDVSDAVQVLSYLFAGSSAIPCLQAADANGDGEVDISDALAVLVFLFTGGLPPPAPFPGCGAGAASRLACESYPACGT